MDDASVSSVEAQAIVGQVGHIVKALKKAGVPADDLDQFSKAVDRGVEPRFWANTGAFNATTASDSIKLAENGTEDFIFRGVVERLERGKNRFAAVWKRRCVSLQRGRLICHPGLETHDATTTHTAAAYVLPLAVQNTTIQIASEAMNHKLGRNYILSVSTRQGVGKPSTTITLAFEDDVELERWTGQIQSAYVADGTMQGPSIYHCCHTGNIHGLDELLARGAAVNMPNMYGATALHYAVRHAATTARGLGQDIRSGQMTEVAMQEAVRGVAHLMAQGADPTVRDAQGETPPDLADRLLEKLPRSRRMLAGVLDARKYESGDGIFGILSTTGKLSDAFNSSTFDKWALTESRSGGQMSFNMIGPISTIPKGRSVSMHRATTAPSPGRGVRATRTWRLENRKSGKNQDKKKKNPDTCSSVGIFFKDTRFGCRCLVDISKSRGRQSATEDRPMSMPVESGTGQPGRRAATAIPSKRTVQQRTKERATIVTNAEALREISRWTRQSARAAKGPPPMHEWAEASQIVSFDDRETLVDALTVLKQKSKGNLVPLKKITSLLERMGQGLSEKELQELSEKTSNQGYIHKDEFPAWLVQARLPSLPPGKAFLEEDDTVTRLKQARQLSADRVTSR